MEPDQPLTGWSRRAVVGALGAAALVGLGCRRGRPVLGGFADDAGAVGHRVVRDGEGAPPVREVRRADVVIVGGGVAGLGAGWHLDRAGARDWVCLELEPVAGGTARAGRNAIGPFPWGAHYVPMPNAGATHVRALFTDLGVLRPDGTADERARCFPPQERLFRQGRWVTGLEEPLLERAAAREDWARLQAAVADERARGRFAVPSLGDRTIGDPLDGMTMATWLDAHGVVTPEVRWIVDYACRDDYGARPADVSAWAGVHYWAAREHAGEAPLTWPAGNGWIVEQLAARAGVRLRLGAPVHRVSRRPGGVSVFTGDVRWDADAAVLAVPAFVAARLVDGVPAVDLPYSPWLVANLELERRPGGDGSGAWDSVLYDSPALGYVDASHQSLRTGGPTTWTYYWALADEAPLAARRRLRDDGYAAWRGRILADLARAHPDLADHLVRLDLVRHGHAMARPVPGFLSHPVRLALQRAAPPIVFAHADVSGMPLFEEAFEAAAQAVARLMER